MEFAGKAAGAEQDALAGEVLMFFVAIMRDENVAVGERRRCAELLGKRLGLFDDKKGGEGISVEWAEE